jgi:hypothetical protein
LHDSIVKPYVVYLITTPGFWYAGSTTIGAKKRFKQHMGSGGQSGAPLLVAKVKELGSDAFHQTIVERGSGDPLEAEQRWYDFYLAHDARQTLNGKRPDSWDGSFRGKTHTPEAKAKISAATIGNTRGKGIVFTPERLAKMSAAAKGNTHTKGWKFGPPSAERRAKISASKKGKKLGPQSAKHRANNRASHGWSI